MVTVSWHWWIRQPICCQKGNDIDVNMSMLELWIRDKRIDAGVSVMKSSGRQRSGYLSTSYTNLSGYLLPQHVLTRRRRGRRYSLGGASRGYRGLRSTLITPSRVLFESQSSRVWLAVRGEGRLPSRRCESDSGTAARFNPGRWKVSEIARGGTASLDRGESAITYARSHPCWSWLAACRNVW